jgi:anti-sigma factor RsiW
MTEAHHHIPDAQLLLHSSGELPAALSAEVATHVQNCSACRARLQKLENALGEFARAHFEASDLELPSALVPRARLQERLAELSSQRRENGPYRPAVSGNWFLPTRWVAAVSGRRRSAMLSAIVTAGCLLLAIRLYGPGPYGNGAGSYSQSASLFATHAQSEEPDLRLTPGATLPVSQSQVCGAEADRTTAAVPVSLKRKVFEEYGVAASQPDAYEVDYLITPELGGAMDIRNLWPEPYEDTVWNAHVKDQLEERLHRLVCRGDVDLATAQHDISTDWIAAYRKYFHADKPVADNSSLNSTGARRSHPLT